MKGAVCIRVPAGRPGGEKKSYETSENEIRQQADK
jgi:hypothetical protein